MTAVLPVLAGREPDPFDPHREIAVASRTRPLYQVISTTELRAIATLSVVRRGLLAPSQADPKKACAGEQPSRTEKQEAIEVAIMALRIWRTIVVCGTRIVVRCANACD